MPLLSVEGLSVALSRKRGDQPIIEDLGFSLEAGEILGLVGESGAGKSLTGMAILGLIAPPLYQSAGAIFFDGRRIDRLTPRAFDALRGRQIAAVFQDSMSSLNPIMTIGRQLTETIAVHHGLAGAEAEARAAALLAEVGIPAPRDRLRAYPHQLSGGMRQRVVLALAFACAPRLLIADEPTTALDVSLQAQVMGLIRAMAAERGTAVIFISHNIGLVAGTASRIAVLYAGRLAEIGPVADVSRAPQHPYTRGLIAAIPRMDRPPRRLAQIGGAMPSVERRPGGCAFHPRCPVVMARCVGEHPPLIARGGVRAACWRLDPFAPAGQGAATQDDAAHLDAGHG